LTAPAEHELAAPAEHELAAPEHEHELTAPAERELAAPEPELAASELEQPALALAPEPVADASDDATLDAQAWDELNAALEPAEGAPEAVAAPPATPEGGFDDDAPTLTNLAPAEPEQTTPDADPNDDNRETSA